ncbi:hypothetical protein X777_04250 [Ooceraea biroi]|uniref:Uncharacterized protein n=1 Tax=Ooceraea biroi TaxID=2015173 RepID=A0A026WKL8_OOCBI|nr:hypothetical protein X777_04250 [Ooceraea biroi]
MPCMVCAYTNIESSIMLMIVRGAHTVRKPLLFSIDIAPPNQECSLFMCPDRR